MTNIARDKKKSNFTAQSAIPSGSYFDFVYNGQNYKISKADMIGEFGTTGTISQKGDPTQTPILNIDGTDNQIRNLEDGSGVKASISPQGGALLDHNFQQDDTGVQILKDIDAASPTIRTLVAGSGISIGAQNGNIQIAISETPASTKTIIINELADFPEPVTGVITLEADTNYFVVNDVSLGVNRLVFGANTVLSATSDYLITLTYTGTGTMMTSSGVSFRVEDIILSCENGQLIDVSCSTNEAQVQFVDCTVSSCDVVGEANGVLLINFEKLSFGDIKTNGLTLTGNNTIVRIDASNANLNGGSLVDLGTSTTFAVSIASSFVTTAAGTVVLSGLPDSGNILPGGLGVVFNVRAIGDGSALSGISQTDTRWEFLLNSSVPNSTTSLLATHSGATLSIPAANTPVIIGNTWSFNNESRFEGDPAGTFKYTGKGALVSLSATISADLVTGIDACTFYFYKNGVQETGSAVQREFDAGDPGNISMVWQLVLETNDEVSIYAENNDTAVDITIINAILGING